MLRPSEGTVTTMSATFVNHLLVRALIAFLLLPGMVAFVIPAFLIAPRHVRPFDYQLGLLPLTAGTILLCWCVREFYVAGRGTLAPWAPPTSLVVTGPYRVSRNPMYVAVLLILCDWAAAYRSPALAIYAGAIAIAFHVRVVYYEEPWLARMDADAWAAYRARVSRWLGIPH
jgi:protein-S-isoprenylcysteine O-methyltransferase Ste14